MSEATEKLTDFEDKVIEFLTSVQESVVNGLRTIADELENRLPEVNVPYAENLPTDSPGIGNNPADGNVVATIVPLGRVFAGRLLSEWWETHPSAGSPEGLSNLTGPPLGKPPLRVCVHLAG